MYMVSNGGNRSKLDAGSRGWLILSERKREKTRSFGNGKELDGMDPRGEGGKEIGGEREREIRC